MVYTSACSPYCNKMLVIIGQRLAMVYTSAAALLIVIRCWPL